MLTPEDVQANPIGTTLLFEDDRVRIWQIVLDPGQDAPFHTHNLDYTTVTVEGGVLERPNGDGTADRIVTEPGRVTRWYQSTPSHALRNVGITRFRNVIVEIKGLPADFASLDERSR